MYFSKSEKRPQKGLHIIDKGDLPLHSWHIHFLGPLLTTKLNERIGTIFAIIDAFIKFYWLIPTKGTISIEIIHKLKLLQEKLNNLKKIEIIQHVYHIYHLIYMILIVEQGLHHMILKGILEKLMCTMSIL